jgi:Rrf2 family protein
MIMNKLINISEATSIAIHSLAIISRKEEMVNAQYLSDVTGFSKNHISKVLQILVKQGYIASTRGPKGGFKTLMDTGNLTLLEIYELFDGHINSDFCKNHKEICPFIDCSISEIIDDLTKTFIEKFGNKKIGDLAFKF